MRNATRNTALMLLLASAALSACGKEPPPPAEEPVEEPTIEPIYDVENANEQAPEEYKVLMETSAGNVVIAVHRAWAPLGADRFYNLVKLGFYDDTRIYRVVTDFMAQWGFNGEPRVNSVWRGYPIADDPVTRSNDRGTLTFATSGANARTTQVFINFQNNYFLDESGFAPFAEVVEGMNVATRFYARYGDGPPQGQGPNQQQIFTEGNAYLDASFPELTKIIKMSIQEDAPPAS
jgi:peptidyl-prolyl cis-trans isomerase A (cyclophilin A)